MYDFNDVHGNLNENVFAYSNRAGNERAVICYHNKYAETAGWIKISIGRNIASTDEPKISQASLADALGICGEDNYYYMFRDRKSTLEYIRSGREFHERGIYVELKAFQYRIFINFCEIHDTTGVYRDLCDQLQGRGVPDMQLALREYQLTPVHSALQEFLSKQVVGEIVQICFAGVKKSKSYEQKLNQIIQKFGHLLKQTATVVPEVSNTPTIVEEFRNDLTTFEEFLSGMLSGKSIKGMSSRSMKGATVSKVGFKSGSDDRNILVLISWLVSRRLLQVAGDDGFSQLGLGGAFERIFQNAGRSSEELNDDLALLSILLRHQTVFVNLTKEDGYQVLADLLEHRDVQDRIKVNVYNGIVYYNKEAFEELMWWLFIVESFEQMRMQTKATKGTIDGFDRLSDALKVSNGCTFKFETLKFLLAPQSGETIVKP